ncbi:hypothetical protein ABPG73_022659, partial [Tetrahymena malaccensis]
FKALFKSKNDKEIEKIEICISKANFVQKNGFNKFIQHISSFENLQRINLTIEQQLFCEEEINSLSSVIQNLQKLNLLQLTFKEKIFKADEYHILFNSICNSLCLKQVEITITYHDLGPEECLAIQKCVINSQSLLNLKIKYAYENQGLISYNINQKKNLSEENQFIYLTIENINFTKIEGLKLLLQSLDSFKKLSDLMLMLVDLQINKVSINQEVLLSSIADSDLQQIQYPQFEISSHYNIQSLNSTQICQDQDIEIEINDFSFDSNNLLGWFLSPIKFNQNAKKLELKISQKFFIEEKQAEHLLSTFQQLKQLQITFYQLQLEQKAIKLVSELLSQLQSVQTLKLFILQDQFDASTFFIDEIIKNKFIEEIYLNFSYLKTDTNFQEWAKKLSSMQSLKKLTIDFQNCETEGRAIEFCKNLNDNKQSSSLLELKMKFNNDLNNQQVIDLAQYLSCQRLVSSLVIQMTVEQQQDIEKIITFLNQFKNDNIFMFQFQLYDNLYIEEQKQKLYLELKQNLLKMKRMVNLFLK